MRSHASGVAVVGLVVGVDGLPEYVHIVRSAGKTVDKEALIEVRKYRFKPAMLQGKPVPVEIVIEVKLQMD
jgi:TonB family protein